MAGIRSLRDINFFATREARGKKIYPARRRLAILFSAILLIAAEIRVRNKKAREIAIMFSNCFYFIYFVSAYINYINYLFLFIEFFYN